MLCRPTNFFNTLSHPLFLSYFRTWIYDYRKMKRTNNPDRSDVTSKRATTISVIASHNNETEIMARSSKKEVSLRSWWQRLFYVACAMRLRLTDGRSCITLTWFTCRAEGFSKFTLHQRDGWICVPLVRESRAQEREKERGREKVKVSEEHCGKYCYERLARRKKIRPS